ncbi:MAG: sugar-transfer associated ATP-grasp domain-containing protein [Oscillospiraceae bacterium]
MGKVKYIMSRLRDMDYGKMWETAKKVHAKTGKNSFVILIDIMYCGYKYMAGYMDYIVFEFYRLNAEQRKTYITRGVNNGYVKALNTPESWYKFEDKPTFNKLFDKYMHRVWLDLSTATEQEFEDFLKDKEKIVCKPVDATCGKGIVFIERQYYGNIAELYSRLKQNKQFLVEQFVVQNHIISNIYPRSVNTVRLVTMLVQNVPHVVFSSIRIGNGLMVDNLNSGGMATVIDLQTGIITKPAMDKENILYEVHPFTGTQIVGTQIPFFKEAVEMVKKAALVVPEMGYIGWDVAIAEDGPLLIEANHFPGHDIYQFQPHLDNGIGLKPRFDKVIRGEN